MGSASNLKLGGNVGGTRARAQGAIQISVWTECRPVVVCIKNM